LNGNYAWETPDDTDLVKDGAAAIRTLGSSIDTTTKALNPSTTLGDIEYRSSTANTNTRLGVGTTGQVLTVAGGVPSWATPAIPNLVGTSLTKSAGQSIANATYTAISFDGEDYDTDAFHDNSTNNSRITIPSGKAGKYLVTANISLESGAGNFRIINIYKNGSGTGDNTVATVSGFGTIVVKTVVMNLAVGDYIQAFVYQNSGGSLNANTTATFGTTLQVTYLGA